MGYRDTGKYLNLEDYSIIINGTRDTNYFEKYIDDLKLVYDLVNKYLKFPEISSRRVTSIIPKVIKALCSNDIDESLMDIDNAKSFEILEKIEFNNLLDSEYIIKEYAPYTFVIARIYNEFDQSGKMKSQSILMKLRREYLKLSKNIIDANELFSAIINSIVNEMSNDEELIDAAISIEELECVLK